MMSSPAPQSDAKPKLDSLKLISQLFSYVKHIRLMLLMLALGICAGIVYFLFSIPTYQSTSLVYVKNFRSTVEGAGLPNVLDRGFLTRFRSQLVMIGAAQRLGLIQSPATYESVLAHIPKVQVSFYDNSHMELTVFAYDPEVVRNLPEAMIEEFLSFQEKNWKEYRDEALERYGAELAQLDLQVLKNLDSISEVARDKRLTEITIEQQSLLEIPVRLVQTREKMARMNDVRTIMSNLKADELSAPNPDEVLKLLSLLTKLEEDTVVKAGDVVSAPMAPGSAPVTALAPETRIETVVDPSKIAELHPWRELEKKKRGLEAQVKEALLTYLPDSGVVKRLQSEIAETDRALLSELNVARERFELDFARLQEMEKLLAARMPEYYAVTEELGKSSNAFASVSSKQEMWNVARDTLSKKLAAITFTEDFDRVQIRFKEFIKLRDQIPVSPSKSKLALMSLMLGLAGALAVPTLLNLFDTSASTVQQLEESTGLRGIGIVPLTTKEFLEEVHRSPAQGAMIPNYLLECFRVIRSNICLNPNHRDRSQVVLVTSARPQEGKTTQAANLAWAFYSMGERTLLIDCDLRRGRVHSLLKLENYPGMTRMLIGECTPQEAIQPTGLDGFDAIPRGSVIAGTTELLCQLPFEELIGQLRKVYDRIVIDSPPVLGLSESSSLQRLVDGTILVVRAEKTSRKDVLDAIATLRKSDAHFFGFVLNAVDLSKASNYYYYYYYSAPYYDQLGADEEAIDPAEPEHRPRPPHHRPLRADKEKKADELV
ncbi:MAG: polysaccharide biosynthesis tyrosine autokinase [Verrucomicrobiae bacterium]|nr:polysaccharide biosynthesis tyrosine autokinase [Verrucomicrobiae bacterium]